MCRIDGGNVQSGFQAKAADFVFAITEKWISLAFGEDCLLTALIDAR